MILNQSNHPDRRTKGRLRSRGVTLVEVVIVLSIIGLIASGVAMVAVPELAKARVKTARIDLASLQPIAARYKDEFPAQGCPTADMLKAQKLTSGSTSDPWGSPYIIECEGEKLTVRSPGPDRVPNNADDLVQPDENRERTGAL